MKAKEARKLSQENFGKMPQWAVEKIQKAIDRGEFEIDTNNIPDIDKAILRAHGYAVNEYKWIDPADPAFSKKHGGEIGHKISW